MNRKQKVAVVVGGLVIALLALFPPWVVQADTGGKLEPWSVKYGPTWIGNPPHSPFHKKVLQWPDFPEAEESTVRTTYGSVEIDVWALLPSVVAALALTVAAVVVLKDSKT